MRMSETCRSNNNNKHKNNNSDNPLTSCRTYGGNNSQSRLRFQAFLSFILTSSFKQWLSVSQLGKPCSRTMALSSYLVLCAYQYSVFKWRLGTTSIASKYRVLQKLTACNVLYAVCPDECPSVRVIKVEQAHRQTDIDAYTCKKKLCNERLRKR